MAKITFKQFLEAQTADVVFPERKLPNKPEKKDPADGFKFSVRKKIATKDDDDDEDGNKTSAALNLKDTMKRSKIMGHSGTVASLMGIYPT